MVPAEAQPPSVPQCDEREAAELRAHLVREQHLATRWNTIWAITFGAAAVGSAAVAYANPLPEMQNGLYVTAGKAGIAALSRIIIPLRIGVPAQAADVCTDLESLRKAVRAAAKKERNTFYLNHIGGLLLHGAGAAILWNTDGAKVALLNVALGYPVGLLSNYLAPRNSWHLYRERNWTVGVVPQLNAGAGSAWLVTVGGEL